MHSEDAKKIKCDRCDGVIGLYQHDKGWRCPLCIWKERENLIKQAKGVLSSSDYHYASGETTKVYRKNMDALAIAVQRAVSSWKVSR